MPVLEYGKPKIFDWPVMMTRVYFTIADSTYDYTLSREPCGTFYFAPGFDQVDDSLSTGAVMVMSPIGGKHQRKDTLESKTYKPSYHWTANEIHSSSRFPPFSAERDSHLNIPDSEFISSPYVAELAYTSVQDSLHLSDIFKSPANDVIRLTRIKDFWGRSATIEFYEVILDDPTDPKFKYMNAVIDSSRKCKISLDLAFSLNKRDTKAFMKAVRSVENEKITFLTKADLDEPFLIEIWRGGKYTVLERSSGINPDRDFRSEYCGIFWNAERLRKRYEKKQTRQ